MNSLTTHAELLGDLTRLMTGENALSDQQTGELIRPRITVRPRGPPGTSSDLDTATQDRRSSQIKTPRRQQRPWSLQLDDAAVVAVSVIVQPLDPGVVMRVAAAATNETVPDHDSQPPVCPWESAPGRLLAVRG